MQIIEKYTTNSPCYNNGRYIKPEGLMLHSIGCAQPNALSIVNNFNKSTAQAAVHGVLQADGTVYQCLPWKTRAWHCGSGPNGSGNSTHIGVEMTEPKQLVYSKGDRFTCSDMDAARAQVKGTYNTAVELFAHLCKMFNLDPLKDGVIISHAEGYKRGIASGHSDPTHMWSQLGMPYTMDGFRKDVAAAMGGSYKPTSTPVPVITEKQESHPVLRKGTKSAAVKEMQTLLIKRGFSCGNSGADGSFGGDTLKAVKAFQEANGLEVDGVCGPMTWEALLKEEFKPYVGRVTASILNVREGPSTDYDIVNELERGGGYTIVKEKDGWGLLKSYSVKENGWVCLKYIEKV